MKFSYDDDVDVMYISFVKTSSKVTYLENDEGDILRFTGDGKLVGVTIPSFMERMKKFGAIEIPQIGKIDFSPEMEKLIDSRSTHVKTRDKAHVH